jgi:hypothetical protein
MCLACQVTARMADVEAQQHPARSEWFWAELGVLREKLPLAGHPYMEAWRRGELSRSDLQILATEQDHVVVATAAAARRTARLYDGLAANRVADRPAVRSDQTKVMAA